MTRPMFSVIIPVYNNAEFLKDSISSVLDQTYPHFELLIVNDASPDHAEEVIKSFTDPRIRYIKHDVNKGLSEARNTGILNSVAEYIALLDGDDYFHKEKLQAHAEFLDQNRDIDVTYNPRYELNHSSKTIRGLWRPPLIVDLADLILGYPFSPSDMVVRRSCMFKVGLFDKSHTYYGEDLDINCKLAIEGYKFASVNRALNYRRYHSRRVIKNLSAYREDELRPLYKTFADPRYPSNLSSLKDKALSNRYTTWSIFAHLQNDSAFGQESILKAVELDPSIVLGNPCKFLEQIIHFCTLDDTLDHECLIDQFMSQLPEELKFLTDQTEWAKFQGYLIRATRAVMWDRRQDGDAYFEKASSYHHEIDRAFLQHLSADLLSYEVELGPEAARTVFKNLSPDLKKFAGSENLNWLEGHLSVNRGFNEYALRNYKKVPPAILQAVFHDPTYLLNRGVMKIFLDSLVKNVHQAGT